MRVATRLLTSRVTRRAALNRDWHFEQDADARWRWKRVDDAGGHIESAQSFATEVDCMLDAVRFAVRRRRGDACWNDDSQMR